MQGRGQVTLHLGESVGRGRLAPQQLLAHQSGLRRQRHDLLLDPVVQDRLDPAPLGVLARHDPVPEAASSAARYRLCTPTAAWAAK